MIGKIFAVCAIICCHEVTSQSSSTSTTTPATPTLTLGVGGQRPWNVQSSNSSRNDSNQAPVTQFFGQILRGEVWGIRKCKKAKDCGLGLRCDALLNLCVPFNTPLLTDIEKPCQNSSECSGMHVCQAGFCRFCGPKSCRTSGDCCAGWYSTPQLHGAFFECANIEDFEKVELAKQLGRLPANYQPTPKPPKLAGVKKAKGAKSPEDEFGIESDEILALGGGAQGDQAMYGKRCWARCNVDNDCYFPSTSAETKKALGCCNGVCTRRQSCVKVSPQAIQQMQALQQQQQLQLQQQALLQQQQQQLAVQQQAQLAAQQQLSLQASLGQQQQQGGAQWGNGVVNVNVAGQQWQPKPQSWQEAQQQQGQQGGVVNVNLNQGGLGGSGVVIP